MEAYNDKNLLFAARLTPYRSLSPRGFRILMGLIAFVCLSIGTVFFALGLWPVLGFMGLDVALIYFAFKLNYRSARAYEEVEISRQHILVRKVSPAGKAHEHIFQQFGTRFEVDRHEEIGITKMWLKNRKRELSFGYFLNPLDRESFSSEFALAMARAKA
ncbi:MAG: hypothetical protein COC23_03015 [Hyphomicrobiales bacterium]|nr:MAG: hypothetical protein COC23_03015 [Hyphomicrobiales bacterium]